MADFNIKVSPAIHTQCIYLWGTFSDLKYYSPFSISDYINCTNLVIRAPPDIVSSLCRISSEVKVLFDQDDRVFADLLCQLDLLHYEVHIGIGAFFHLVGVVMSFTTSRSNLIRLISVSSFPCLADGDLPDAVTRYQDRNSSLIPEEKTQEPFPDGDIAA